MARLEAPNEATRLDESVNAAWPEVSERMRALSQQIWQNPELGLTEHHAAGLLSGWLKEEGFSLTTDAALPTAFVASAGDGRPTIGFLLEYDALPALSNAAKPAREPLERNGAGHACGHNLIGAANAAAAILVKRAADAAGLKGRVLAYGTPAEEILVGKVAMLDARFFEGCDVLLTHHADYANAAVSRPCQSIVHFEVAFCGAAAHTGVVRSQNALDAAELLVQTVERLRAHRFADVSIEHSIRCPTFVMPSNTPEEVRVWFYVRHADYGTAEDAYRRIVEQATAAAVATGVDVDSAVVSSCRGYLPNDVLGGVLFEKLKAVGPPKLDDEEIEFLRELVQAYAPGAPFTLHREIEFLTEGVDAYGQDDGEVSWHVPVGRVNYACPSALPLHSWAATSFFATTAAFKGAAMCAQTLARTGTALLAQPELVGDARNEMTQRCPSAPRRSLAGAWHAMLADPPRFWDGSWGFS